MESRLHRYETIGEERLEDLIVDARSKEEHIKSRMRRPLDTHYLMWNIMSTP